ncbi:hypothetical protein IVB55_05070 [Bradyrhizobium sp. CW4]|uniref:hypothetical protein n=1 Tax=Bradyrhizobium sp. CW4 TaxID=2782687 RepID=UPI001FFB6D95|nr:hypothetical protein [Bradyrhizobium sp. CW4]MCK1412426.1 hypothetical protein [Bradyrhizobium sp. CW4]
MPMALIVAAKPYLEELWQAVDKSRIYVIAAEFEHAVSLAIEHQPDLILVASPPIPEALQTCQRLLENDSTRNIPIFLISLAYNTVEGCLPTFRATAPRVGTGEFSHRSPPRRGSGKFDRDSMVEAQRQAQLLSILDLLRYAEAEIEELGIETSAALLGATIADVAQNLEQHPG